MDSKTIIDVENIEKSYKIYIDKAKTLKEKILFIHKNKYETRDVLKGVSFKVKKGEAVGLIGKNGCGKSTILKILARILYPDKGKIMIDGRVSSLIELGAGFHPDMSGRENIYTNASIFGLNRKEIDIRLHEIIRFSELEEFIDNPIRTYSSGMYMRLAFSVAVNVDADILLIDEILAVGDVNFQKKCFDKIKEIKEKGTTIILVSHSLSQIEELCDTSIWIKDGKICEMGKPVDVHFSYQSYMEEKRLKRIRAEKKNDEEFTELSKFCNKLAIRNGNRKIEFTDVYLSDDKGNLSNNFRTGSNILLNLKYKANEKIKEGNFSFGITRIDGICCFSTNVMIEQEKMVPIKESGRISISLLECELLSGRYLVNVAVISETGEVYDEIQRVLFFEIQSFKEDLGVYRMKNTWEIN